MVLTVFRSRLQPEHAEEFRALADAMRKEAEAMPGFVSYKLYTAEDGERCSIIEFETAEQLMAWRQHSGHAEAMRLGRQRFYSEFTSFVGEPMRVSRFAR